MILNGLIFSHFYKSITDYIYINDLVESQREKISSGGSEIWNERQFGNDRKKFIYQLYLPKGVGRKYMTNKKSSLKPDSNKEEDVSDRVIIHVLQKLDYKYPKAIADDNEISRIKAKVLMQYFIKEKMPKFYNDNEQFYHVFDENKQQLIIENLNRKKIKNGGEIVSNNKLGDPEKIIEIVKEYFKLLLEPDFDKAAKFWITEKQEYSKSLPIFSLLSGVSGIRLMKVSEPLKFGYSNHSIRRSCHVIYKEYIYEFPQINTLYGFFGYKLDEAAKFLKDLKNVKMKLIDNGFDDFSDIYLTDALSPMFFEKIVNKGLDLDKLKTIFKSGSNTVPVLRLCVVSLANVNDNWLIEHIERIDDINQTYFEFD